MKPATIQDIAREAAVSKATVSRVLNGTTAVHEDKRRAVLEAIDRLGFEPSVVARSLAKGRSMTLGVLTQNIGAPFYDAIAQGVIAGLGVFGPVDPEKAAFHMNRAAQAHDYDHGLEFLDRLP